MRKEYPPPIYGNVPGTWANSTVCERLPVIAGRVIEENHYSDAINKKLNQLQGEITHQSIRTLEDQDAPDYEDWSEYIRPHLDQSWIDVPWFFAEHYFYRRIMEAVDYFQLNQDPFGYQKKQGLEVSKDEILQLSRFLQEGIELGGNPQDTLREGIYFSLWGNQADLSLWPAGSEFSPKHGSQKSLQEHLLADDMHPFLKLVFGGPQSLPRVDIMLDNAGFELISDLALVDIMLSHDLVDLIVLQAKAHPTFVSDVICVDILEAVEFLKKLPAPAAKSFGERLAYYLRTNRIQITNHFFWNSPLPMWELPQDIIEEWGHSSLVISKGDANYRRLLGDRQWEMTVPFQEAIDYLPVPLVALRTLKAELAVGMDEGQIQEIQAQDPTWLVGGRWGVIHFAVNNTIGNRN
jgi:uncharacterized protein with ATP-grasp and redox domains